MMTLDFKDVDFCNESGRQTLFGVGVCQSFLIVSKLKSCFCNNSGTV